MAKDDAAKKGSEKKDVEMKDKEADDKKKAEEAAKEEIPLTPLQELFASVALLEKGVVSKESRHIARVLRQMNRVRRKLTTQALTEAIETCLPATSEQRGQLLAWVKKVPEDDLPMDTSTAETSDAATAAVPEKREPSTCEVEVEVFLHLFVSIFMIDRKLPDAAIEATTALLARIKGLNHRTLDQLAAKAYFYYAHAFELVGRLSEVRSELLAAHRTASLRHDQVGQACLLNLLLRNYLKYNLYEHADALVRKTTFPEENASNAQHARYLYYTGAIKAVQLEYTEAYRCLTHAVRQAPTTTGLGFRLTVHKLACIVQLLMGEIPDRSTFVQSGMVKELKPYLELTQAVRTGDLSAFKTMMAEYAKGFQQDRTYTLIVRLRHNVIKTALRKINLTYSSISVKEVAQKLHLDATEDAEFIVAKAIHDGVIDASIDHAAGVVVSKGTFDVYNTDEPQAQFHKRISFCLDMHNQAVKAMRFPPGAHRRRHGETEEERKERLQAEEDIAAAIEEDDF